jgi:hypothetical protein
LSRCGTASRPSGAPSSNEAIRRTELERLDFKLSTLPPEARTRVDEITHLIIEKLLLMPTEQLKSVGDADTVATYSEALTRLFGLGEVESSTPPAQAERRIESFPRPGPRARR